MEEAFSILRLWCDLTENGTFSLPAPVGHFSQHPQTNGQPWHPQAPKMIRTFEKGVQKGARESEEHVQGQRTRQVRVLSLCH